MSDYDDPEAWTFKVEPASSGRGFIVYLRSTKPLSCLRYGPSGYGWHCWTANGAVGKGVRELERYRAQLRKKAEKKRQIEEAMEARA